MTLHIITITHGTVTYPPPADIRYGDLVRVRNTARRQGLPAATQCAQLTAQIADFFRPRGAIPVQPGVNQREMFYMTTKERPILFSGPMVRALLDGSKTQTRRVVKPQPIENNRFVGGAYIPQPKRTMRPFQKNGDIAVGSPCIYECCPYGQPGDRLWVRETFYCDDAFYPDGLDVDCMWREVDGQREPIPIEEQRKNMLESMYYRADGEPKFEAGPTPWRPSIHMPRWASRITLEITGVRVERLHDISIEDAKAEGAWGPDESIVGQVAKHFGIDVLAVNPCNAYRKLWKSINGPSSWDANPWVWVIEFKKVAQP